MSSSTLSRQARTTPPSGVKAGPSLRRSGDNVSGWAFAAPFLVFFLVFLVWPILYGFYMSLTGKSLTGANDAVIGFANYPRLSPTQGCGVPSATRSISR